MGRLFGALGILIAFASVPLFNEQRYSEGVGIIITSLAFSIAGIFINEVESNKKKIK